jgi:hypothetical protein
VTLASTPLTFGFFTARFDTNGTFTLEGEGWPPIALAAASAQQDLRPDETGSMRICWLNLLPDREQ